MIKDHQSAIVAIIPARYGSTRFPGKILAPIHGKSLIQHTYENATRCSLLDDILIATDDLRIYDHVNSFGGKAVMTPIECANGSDRLACVIDQFPSLQNASVIVNIQGDEPCVEPSVTENIVKILQGDPSAVMSTAVVPITTEEEAANPGDVKCVLDLYGNVLYFSRALIPGNLNNTYRPNTIYYKHLGIYAYRPQFLLTYRDLPMTPLQRTEDLEQLKVLEHGYKIKAAVVNSASIGVNTPEDIKKVEQELCKQNSYS